jgi:hypothetical protein
MPYIKVIAKGVGGISLMNYTKYEVIPIINYLSTMP